MSYCPSHHNPVSRGQYKAASLFWSLHYCTFQGPSLLALCHIIATLQSRCLSIVLCSLCVCLVSPVILIPGGLDRWLLFPLYSLDLPWCLAQCAVWSGSSVSAYSQAGYLTVPTMHIWRELNPTSLLICSNPAPPEQDQILQSTSFEDAYS